jgi:hypothetical protein
LAGTITDKGFALMSKYIETIAEALIDVLNGVAGIRDHRIVVYAANVDFWIDEIAHCVTTIDDSPRRQQLFVDAVKYNADKIRVARIRRGVIADPTQLLYGEAPTSIQLENYLEKTARLRAGLIEATRNFLGRMRNDGFISLEKWQMVFRWYHPSWGSAWRYFTWGLGVIAVGALLIVVDLFL